MPAPEGMTPDQHKIYLDELGMGTPAAWLDTDGNLYVWRMPPSMSPPVGLVDSPTVIPPGQPGYADLVVDVIPEYDYRGVEVPDAQGADGHAQGR